MFYLLGRGRFGLWRSQGWPPWLVFPSFVFMFACFMSPNSLLVNMISAGVTQRGDCAIGEVTTA